MPQKLTYNLNIEYLKKIGNPINTYGSKYQKEYLDKFVIFDKEELKPHLEKEKKKRRYSKEHLFVIFSYSLELIEVFYEVYGKKNPSIIVFPSKDFLYTFLHKFDIRNILHSKSMIVTGNIGDVCSAFQVGLRGIKTFVYAPIDLYDGLIQQSMNEIHTYMSHMKTNVNTMSILGKLMCYNQFTNLKEYVKYPTIKTIKDAAKGKPVICIAAGKSIMENIEYLKKIQKHVYIVACISIYKTLIQHGINPDLATVLDMNNVVTKYLDGEDMVCPIVFDLNAAPKILDIKSDFISSFAADTSNNYMIDVFNEHNVDYETLPMSFTVAFLSINIANYMGASEIILLGQDLAYSVGKSHADGCALTYDIDIIRKDGVEWLKLKDELTECVRVNNWNNDGTVPTTRLFLSYRTQLEVFAKQYKIINSTEGGSRIDNTEHITLKKAYSKYIKDNKTQKEQLYKPLTAEYQYSELHASLVETWSRILKEIEALTYTDTKALNKYVTDNNSFMKLSKIYMHSHYYLFNYFGLKGCDQETINKICHKAILETARFVNTMLDKH